MQHYQNIRSMFKSSHDCVALLLFVLAFYISPVGFITISFFVFHNFVVAIVSEIICTMRVARRKSAGQEGPPVGFLVLPIFQLFLSVLVPCLTEVCFNWHAEFLCSSCTHIWTDRFNVFHNIKQFGHGHVFVVRRTLSSFEVLFSDCFAALISLLFSMLGVSLPI